MMNVFAEENLIGWAVIREYPWDVLGIFQTRAEAQSRANDLGRGHTAQHGERQLDPDSFQSSGLHDNSTMIAGSIFEPDHSSEKQELIPMLWNFE